MPCLLFYLAGYKLPGYDCSGKKTKQQQFFSAQSISYIFISGKQINSPAAIEQTR